VLFLIDCVCNDVCDFVALFVIMFVRVKLWSQVRYDYDMRLRQIIDMLIFRFIGECCSELV